MPEACNRLIASSISSAFDAASCYFDINEKREGVSNPQQCLPQNEDFMSHTARLYSYLLTLSPTVDDFSFKDRRRTLVRNKLQDW
jgi:hypothetical protein